MMQLSPESDIGVIVTNLMAIFAKHDFSLEDCSAYRSLAVDAYVAGWASVPGNREVDYVVPANDRSKKSVDLIIETIKKEITE